jgi:ABC-type dipeptide/oligopeptide/nickel transport system permease component
VTEPSPEPPAAVDKEKRDGLGPSHGPRRQKVRRSHLSPFARYTLRRLLLIPAQLVFVLFILYLVIDVPSALTGASPESLGAIDQGFATLVVNIFTLNWGTADYLRYNLPWTQVFAYYLPPSIQLAAFALPIAAVLAYPVSLLAGWSRRPGLDAPVRLATLGAAMLPAFMLGTLILNLVFFNYLDWFDDVPGQGLIPSSAYFIDHNGPPSWILYGLITQPTGFPLIDAILHHDWTITLITLTKTLIQASAVAVAYLAIFFRHARTIVRSVREEVYIAGARSRGVPEQTILWRHAARAVTPSFLLIFALTIPEYLGVQFAVEVAFADQFGFGYLIFAALVQGYLAPLIPLVFLIAVLVLVWALIVDLIAARLDPRGVMSR